MSSGKWWPFCLGFKELSQWGQVKVYLYVSNFSGDGLIIIKQQAIILDDNKDLKTPNLDTRRGTMS